ncbi:ArsR/SmtB family transcription factor [Streptomyces montanus]|uniref:ArsR/SmtB family transcription factor n=1 Tax=Streptomyces montanus TaxID=2580423 RepID=UPI001FE59394|nr:metalloregulator ArsR/SmtB family transcription factor [Streptomyces montanus]
MTTDLGPALKALADATRRRMLDRLRERNGQTLKELSEDLGMTRQAVSKHVTVLESANLVSAVRRGREKLHYLNPVPIQQIHERWISQYEHDRLNALSSLKTALEETTVTGPDFVYTIYIATTPEELWKALTDPEFTRRYWGAGETAVAVESDWRPGSPVAHRFAGADEPFMRGEVIEADPPRRLTYTVGFVPTPDNPAPDTRRATASFHLEETADSQVKLTIHSSDPRTEMREQVHQGWPVVLSSLKTLLETGRPMPV